MNHVEMLLTESGVPEAEKKWLLWCLEVEHFTGLNSLDGDLLEDGYSLDSYFEMYQKGFTPVMASIATELVSVF